jgi:hypothetical protein
MTGVLIAFDMASMVLLSWVFFRGYAVGQQVSVRNHIILALAATGFSVFSHSLTMMYMAAVGRMIRQAVEKAGLNPKYVTDSKSYRNRVFRIATISMLMVMAQTILGGGAHTKMFPIWIHGGLGIVTVLLNLYAVYLEIRYLILNHLLGHQAAREYENLS